MFSLFALLILPFCVVSIITICTFWKSSFTYGLLLFYYFLLSGNIVVFIKSVFIFYHDITRFSVPFLSLFNFAMLCRVVCQCPYFFTIFVTFLVFICDAFLYSTISTSFSLLFLTPLFLRFLLRDIFITDILICLGFCI